MTMHAVTYRLTALSPGSLDYEYGYLHLFTYLGKFVDTVTDHVMKLIRPDKYVVMQQQFTLEAKQSNIRAPNKTANMYIFLIY